MSERECVYVCVCVCVCEKSVSSVSSSLEFSWILHSGSESFSLDSHTSQKSEDRYH